MSDMILQSDRLKVGSFYWLNVYLYGDSQTMVLAKIIKVNKRDKESIMCNIQALNPLTGELLEREVCHSSFISEVSIDDVRVRVNKFRDQLANFMEQ